MLTARSQAAWLLSRSVHSGNLLDIFCLSEQRPYPSEGTKGHCENCSATDLGTSGGMEVESSIVGRSVQCTEYLGGGDSNGHTAVILYLCDPVLLANCLKGRDRVPKRTVVALCVPRFGAQDAVLS